MPKPIIQIVIVSRVLQGWNKIAEWVDVDERTVMGWEDNNGFPVARVNGYVTTTTALIERWIMDNLDNKKVRGGKIRENRKKVLTAK